MDNPIRLNQVERKHLTWLHSLQTIKKYADRLKAVLLLDKGFTPAQIKEILFISERQIRRVGKIYLAKGLNGFLESRFLGSKSALSDEQQAELKDFLNRNLHSTAKSICAHIRKEYRVRYTSNGVVPLLHRLGFVYKKVKGIPGKCDLAEQKKFIRKYRRIRRKMGKNDKIYFIDAAHPTFNTMLGSGWIIKGEEKTVRTNSGRFRLNIHGAYDPVATESICRVEERITKETAVRLLDKMRERSPKGIIYGVVDNGSCYRAKMFRAHAKRLGIKLLFLPAYSPNLNLIERLWKFFRKIVLYNRYHETLAEFKKSTLDFFRTVNAKYRDELKTLMTENFHLFAAPEQAKS